MKWHLIVILICTSLMIGDVDIFLVVLGVNLRVSHLLAGALLLELCPTQMVFHMLIIGLGFVFVLCPFWEVRYLHDSVPQLLEIFV